MKVTVLVENLKRSLAIVNKGVSTRPQMPILSGVLVRANSEGLELVSTDLEISFWVKLGAKVIEEGEAVLPAKLFTELVSSLPVGPVDLVVEGEKIKIISKNTKSEMLLQKSEDFPSIPRFSKTHLSVGSGVFREKVEKISISSAKDDTRPVLTGILWDIRGDEVVMAATDGYRLGVNKMRIKGDGEKFEGKVILPAKSLVEVSRVASELSEEKILIDINKADQQVIFSIGSVEVASRLIAGDFPPYQQIMPNTYTTRLSFNKDDFADSVKRAKLFARDNANIVKLVVDREKMTIAAESTQVGTNSSDLEVEIEGGDITVAFNAQYLLDYLSICTDEQIVWETEGELKPSVFRTSDEDWVQVVMPVRIQS